MIHWRGPLREKERDTDRRSDSYLAPRFHRDFCSEKIVPFPVWIQLFSVWISFSHTVESRFHSSLRFKVESELICIYEQYCLDVWCVNVRVLLLVPPCLCRMDDIQLCKEITRLKKELHKLVSIPGRIPLDIDSCRLKQAKIVKEKVWHFGK